MLKFRSDELVPYVSVADSAFDPDKLDVNEYVKSLDWKPLLKEGESPTVFHLKRLSRAQKAAVDRHDPSERNAAAVSFGLKRVDNLTGRHGAAVVIKTKSAGDLDEKVTKDCMDQFWSPELFAELATVITLISGLSPLAESPSK
jgi:hypothetical protein